MEKIFVNGMSVKRNEKAPSFVIASVAFKVEDMKAFLDNHNKEGWVNADIKLSGKGNYYAELNTWDGNVKKVKEVDENQEVLNQEQKDELPVIDYPVGGEDDVPDPQDIPF